MDILFRFEFDESYYVNAVVLRALHFEQAIDQFVLIFGHSILRDKVISIHKIY